jgi:hypothetical protein
MDFVSSFSHGCWKSGMLYPKEYKVKLIYDFIFNELKIFWKKWQVLNMENCGTLLLHFTHANGSCTNASSWLTDPASKIKEIKPDDRPPSAKTRTFIMPGES